MKKAVLLFFTLLIFSINAYSQYSKKSKDQYVYVSTSLNYIPAIEDYSFFSTIERQQDLLLLTFQTSNSGTFEIRDSLLRSLDRENNSRFPSQLLGVGASLQIIKPDHSLFHEISLTQTSFSKSSYVEHYSFLDSAGDTRFFQLGYEQKSFALGLRYELGAYFPKRKTAKLKFGISGAVGSTFYSYKRTPASFNDFPINAKLFIVNLAVVPMVKAELSKKLALEFKVLPNILIADFETVEEPNPTIPPGDQVGQRGYDLPELDFGFSLLMKYQIKEPKKRRRRKKTNSENNTSGN